MKIKTKEIFDIESETHEDYITVNMLENNMLEIEYFYKDVLEFTSIKKTVDLNSIFTPVITYTFFLIEGHKGISDPVHAYLTKDKNMEFYKYAYNFRKPILVIYFDKTIDDIMILSNVPYNGECEISDKERLFESIVEEYPAYKYRYKKRNIKNKLFANIDWGSSLSALEAQVDYLTLIIEAMLSENADIMEKTLNKLPGAKNFLNLCLENNVFNVKPEEKMFSDIVEQKQIVRTEQDKYWIELEAVKDEV